MKKSTISNSTLIILIMIQMLLSCDNSEKNLVKAKTLNTIAAYQEFLKMNPKSDYAKEAQESLNWLLTVKSDSVENYQRFIEKYPVSKNVIIANDFINKNLTSEEKILIDLMINAWSIWKYDNYKNQNYLVTNASKLMVNFTGSVWVKVNLGSNSYSNELKKRFKVYDGSRCDYNLKNLEYSFDISNANISQNSEFKCIITSKQNHELSILKGGYKFNNGEAFMNDSSEVSIDNKKFQLINKKWVKI